MTWYPIAFLPPQYQDTSSDNYGGAVLKAYEAGTTTPILMATGYQGATVAPSFELNSSGYPVSGGAVIIPHVQEDYKLALYPDQDSADNNSGAIWTYDDIKIAVEGTTAFVQTFSGDSLTTDFTLSENLGTDEKTLMVFADRSFGEYITNGSFDTDTGWTKGTGWTIASGVATATGDIDTDLEQSALLPLIEGHSYTITYTVTRTAGMVTPNIGGTEGEARDADGTYSETIIAGSTQVLMFTGTGFSGTIDNVSVHHTTTTRREILRPDEFTLDGTSLSITEAPAGGTENILVFAPSLLFGAVGSLVDAAALSEANAAAAALATAADAVSTAADVVTTGNNVTATAADAVSTAADVILAQSWAIDPIGDRPEGSAKYWAEQAEALAGGAAYMQKANNLSDLASAPTARNNLDVYNKSESEALRAIPVTSKSEDYTAVLADANDSLVHPLADANDRTFTIPAHSSVAYPIGTTLTFINLSVNDLSIDITDDTLTLVGEGTTGTRTLARYGQATALKISSTQWTIIGGGLS